MRFVRHSRHSTAPMRNHKRARLSQPKLRLRHRPLATTRPIAASATSEIAAETQASHHPMRRRRMPIRLPIREDGEQVEIVPQVRATIRMRLARITRGDIDQMQLSHKAIRVTDQPINPGTREPIGKAATELLITLRKTPRPQPQNRPQVRHSHHHPAVLRLPVPVAVGEAEANVRSWQSGC